MSNEILFKINKSLFERMVLLKTCYTFINNYYIFLDEDNNDWLVTLKIKDDNFVEDIKKVEGEFRNELINESFRSLLIDKTQKTKEMIVARALYGADSCLTNYGMEDQNFNHIEENIDNYIDDPLGIAVPWEEKYGEED